MIKRAPDRQIMAVIGILQDHILAADSTSTREHIWKTMAMETAPLELAVDLLINVLDEAPDQIGEVAA